MLTIFCPWSLIAQKHLIYEYNVRLQAAKTKVTAKPKLWESNLKIKKKNVYSLYTLDYVKLCTKYQKRKTYRTMVFKLPK